MRRSSSEITQVHGSESEPLLHGSSLGNDHELRLHKPKWCTSNEVKGHPSRWSQFRHIWREELAEFWGSFMILLFGAGVECQINLHYNGDVRTSAAFGDYLQGRLAWAAGVAISCWISGGGHCNPTVTLCLSFFRGFPIRKVPWFLIFQILGSTTASLLVYFNNYHSISIFEGGHDIRTVTGSTSTASLFFTFPATFLPWYSCLFSEFLASALLLFIVFALSDSSSTFSPSKSTQPFALFIVLLAIGSSLGFNTGYAINGARDTGPRIALWLVGYGSKVFTHDGFYFLWNPWVAAISGGIIGAACYDVFLGSEKKNHHHHPSSSFSLPYQEEEEGLGNVVIGQDNHTILI